MKVEILPFFNIAWDGTLPFASQSCDPIGLGQQRVSGSGFQPLPKSPSATLDTRKTLGETTSLCIKNTKQTNKDKRGKGKGVRN